MKHSLPKVLRLLPFQSLVAIAGLALSANVGATVITPTSEVATSQFGDWIDTIDGTGLSGGGASGDILSETHAAGGGGNFALFPGGPDYTGESITFTLPGASTVDRVHLWLDISTWGDITGFDLEFSTDGGTTYPTTVAGITFDGAAADLSVVQTRTFAEQTGVTDIKLSNVVVTGVDSGKAYAGFNEIRFGIDAAPDTTPPTLAGSDIVDDQSGGPVNENTFVTYTVTFSEDIDDTSVSSADFSNAGTSPINFGAINETAPGVFTVEVTPTAVGTLQLQVPIGATIMDMAGLSMDTAAAVLDDDTIDVVAAPTDTTAPTPDPMSFVIAPAASSATSITMEATAASDASGVEYLFIETSGNPGGDSSSWQGSATYEDTGLTTGLQYTYTVTARDLSTNQNATAPSNPASATPQEPSASIVITPASEVATNQFGDWLNTINGIGLSGGGASGDILSETHAASGGGNFALFPGGPDFTGESITFTLTEASRVDRVHLWLERSVWGDVTGFDLEFSTNGGTTFPTTAAGITFDGAAGDLSVVQTRTFVEQTGVTHIRLSNVVVTGGNPAYAGFNEIRFGGTTGPDITPPTLAGSDIVDDQGGASVNENTLVTYTVTFSEDIDDTTVSSADFSNAGTSPISFGAINEVSPGVFTVAVTPTAAGTLQLQVPIGATIKDTVGLSMLTTSAVVDDTAITVTVAPPDNTKPTPDPMSFATAPTPSSATSITMEATPASDAAGVEYLFTETSGNPGGDSSGWQGSTTYEDTGLTTGLVYTYTVTARDLSSNQNATAPSDPASATAETPVVPPVITAPTSRHIVQRSAANVGTIVIAGTYSVGNPEEVEARAVVMAGEENSGTTTTWQTIDASPAGGSFSGTLTNVPAGGWYQLEVRTMLSGVPGGIAVLEKVGVGDIYVTAGQSNSVNTAPAGYIPSDDRVVARSSLTEDLWVFAADPIPTFNSGDPGWGSVWTRLGDMLAAADDIPIGFHAVGVGATIVAQWDPNLYNSQIKPAVQSFPVNGFRAVLWQQGEHDANISTTAATYVSLLGSVITKSRIDAGWNVPWYVAEAAYWNLSQREPVVAGQRMLAHGDPFTFLGEATCDLHTKGYGLHFNEAGTVERAVQYTEILAGIPTLTPVNGHFEDNRNPAITGLSPLADGTSNLLDINDTDRGTNRVLGWHILTASGVDAADGANAYHNPSTGTFAGAIDSVNGGVLPNMDGKHVALLDGGTAGNYFLHSTRALAKPNTTYTLTVALGLRDNAATFGTARLEITADGVVVASAVFDKAALDTLHGSDASGTFTDATITWTTGSTVAANQPLAIRVVKEGGAGTVLDFDNARLTATAVPSNDYNSWINNPAFGIDPADQGFALDPDGDKLANGLEAWFGTHPGELTAGLAGLATDGTTTTFSHPQNPSPPSDVTGFYQWSLNLADWYVGDGVDGPGGGPTVTISPDTVGATTTVTATASEAMDRLFLRVGVTQD